MLRGVRLIDGAVVGTGEEATIRVDGADMSELHVRIMARADGVYVEDVGGEAGTWVNGVRAERMGVAHGDVLRLGSLVSLFVET